MKFVNLALIALLAPAGVAAKGKSPKEPQCPEIVFNRPPSLKKPYPVVDFKHYLVGLLTYSHLFVPEVLTGHTTGVKAGIESTDVPAVGMTDFANVITRTLVNVTDPKTKKVTTTTRFNAIVGDYYVLVDEGYLTSTNSEDFPLHYHRMRFSKEMAYNHAGHTTTNIYDEVEHVSTTLIRDPDSKIKWKGEWDGHDLDIQVTYHAPDDWANDWVPERVLTGRDFSPEGMAADTDNCAVIVDKWGPSMFAMDPLTGHVKSGIIQIPDIVNQTSLALSDKFLTTVSDKRHCYLHELVANTCGVVEDKRIDENGYYEYVKDADGKKEKKFITKYKKIPAGAGPIGAVRMNLANYRLGVVVFGQALKGEPGPRVYAIDIGNCGDCPPKFQFFVGFIKLSPNANAIAAFDDLLGSDTRIVIHEHTTGFPTGLTFPRNANMPSDKLCIVNLEMFQADMPDLVLSEKICVLHYLHISDPYDTTLSGKGFYAQSQKSNSGLKVIDPWCVLIGTDPNYPLDNNDYGLDENNVPFFTEAVQDTRFLIVCFFEPLFQDGYHFSTFTDV